MPDGLKKSFQICMIWGRFFFAQKREKFFGRNTCSLFQCIGRAVGFQAATAAAVAKWAVGINTYMFKSSAVHGDPLMNLMIGNDAAAQISVQQMITALSSSG